MINGLSKGWPFEQCLAFGAAAGAVNARVWQVAAAQYQEVLDLARDVEVRIL
jgi:fructose-1-phosphate kinase PfkB-like protein